MKQFCAVCILLVLTHDRACLSLRGKRLKCNLCVSKGLKDPCTPSVQTCLPHITHCGHIVLRPDLLGSAFIRSCISMMSCWSYMDSKDVTVKCCSTDLCN